MRAVVDVCAELWAVVVDSLRKEDVPRRADRRGRQEHVRKMALADIPQAVEDFDLPTQVRGGSSQRKLGNNRRPLRRQVRNHPVAPRNVANFPLSASLPAISCSGWESTTSAPTPSRIYTRNEGSRSSPPTPSSIRGPSSTIWPFCGSTNLSRSSPTSSQSAYRNLKKTSWEKRPTSLVGGDFMKVNFVSRVTGDVL